MRERGFGIIEVLIAVLMIMVVSSGIILAMTSGSSLRSTTRLQTSMTTTGQRMIEELASENDWMKTCGTPRCPIAQVFDADDRKLEDAEGTVEVVGPAAGTPPANVSHAAPIDSQVDGIGQADEDGVIPDHYQVLLVIRPDAGTAARYSANQSQLTRRLTTALDRNGNILKGSLRVDACVVRNQVDERMSIDGCSSTGVTSLKMDGCPTNPPNSGAFERCEPAWSWVAGALVSTPHTSPSPYVSLERVATNRYSFSIRNLSTGGSPIPSSQADEVDGSYVFKNIEAGTYRITGLPSAISVGGISHPRWRTKEIPAYHNNSAGSVGVQPGIKNHALVMFRPPRTNGGIRYYFDRLVHHYKLVSDTSIEKTPKASSISLAGELWAPTNDYQGTGAGEWCDEQLDTNTAGTYVVYDGSTENGADIYKSNVYMHNEGWLTKYYRQCWIYKTGYATDNDRPNCHVASYRVYFTDYDKDFREPDAVETGSLGPFSYSYTWCTWFRDEYKHKFWSAQQQPDTVKKGAVKTAVYELSPRPTTREINFGPGDSLVGATYPRAYCKVRGHTTNKSYLDQWQCQAGGGMDRLLPGLHTSMFAPTDATVSTNGNGESNPSNAAENGTVNPFRMPGWATGGGLWVRASGQIIGADGTPRTNPTIHLRGDGECYWRGGLYLPTPWEGSCGRCNITWKTTVSYNQQCAMLERTCITRFVAETSARTEEWNVPATGVGTLMPPIKSSPVPISGGSGNCRTYNAEWICETEPPTIIGTGNCNAPPTGPPPGSFNLGPTSHEVSQGTAHVGGRAAVSSPPTY